jgi:gamma-glutamyltranspeptidase
LAITGELTWLAFNRTELFKPAIKVAREGFRVNVDLANAIKGESGLLWSSRRSRFCIC